MKLLLRSILIFIIFNLILNLFSVTASQYASTEVLFEDSGISNYDELFHGTNMDVYSDDIIIIPKTYDDKIIYFANNYTFEYFGIPVPTADQYYSNYNYYETEENIGKIPYVDNSNKIIFKSIEQVNNISSDGINHLYTNMNYPEFDDFLLFLENEAKFKNITFLYNYDNDIIENIFLFIFFILTSVFLALDFYTSLNDKRQIYSQYTLNGFRKFIIFKKINLRKINLLLLFSPIFLLFLLNIGLLSSKSNIVILLITITIYLIIIGIIDVIYYINVINSYKDVKLCMNIIRGKRMNIHGSNIIMSWNIFLRLLSIFVIVLISSLIPNYISTLTEFMYWNEIKEYYYPYTSQYYLREDMRGNSTEFTNGEERLEQEEVILFLENNYDFRYSFMDEVGNEDILICNYNYLKGINFPNLNEIDRNYDYLLVPEEKIGDEEKYVELFSAHINELSQSIENTLSKANIDEKDKKYISERKIDSNDIKIIKYDKSSKFYNYNVDISNSEKYFKTDYIFIPKEDELPSYIATYAIQSGYLYVENIVDDPNKYSSEYFISSGDTEGIENMATRIPTSKYNEYGLYIENIYLIMVTCLTLSLIAIMTFIYNSLFSISFYFNKNKKELLLKRMHGISYKKVYKKMIFNNILLNIMLYFVITVIVMLFFKSVIMIVPYIIIVFLMISLDIVITLKYIKKIENKNMSVVLKGFK